ncbi:hypothetical protein [Herbaspirillum sp. RV1423]|uniref:hypothetical protein n=1 Tax=Herbaspirillum sp. RV1423 TaxID=1443993 RepID=UPI0012DCB1C7|nr:hypothetical protein [Herbaspirillum sp. RV1423]
MNEHIDLTLDLARLMRFTGRIGGALRQYGDGLRDEDQEVSRKCLLLSNLLLHFERLGIDIQRGDSAILAETCTGLVNVCQFYERKNLACTALINLSEVRNIFQDIQTKISPKMAHVRPKFRT